MKFVVPSYRARATSRVYVYSTVVLASVALACEQGQSRESRLHLYFSSPQEGRRLTLRPVHRLPMPSLGRSEQRTFPPVPDETNCHLCLNMASISEFKLVRRELLKNTPPKPFLIGVAGGSASGKVNCLA